MGVINGLSSVSSSFESEHATFKFNTGSYSYTYEGNYSYTDSWDLTDSDEYISAYPESTAVYFPDSLSVSVYYYVDWTEYDYDLWEFVDYYGYAFLDSEDPIYGSNESNLDYWNYVDFYPLEDVNNSIYEFYEPELIEEFIYWWEYDLYDPLTDDWIGTRWAFDWEILVYDSLENVGDLDYLDYWIYYEVIDLEVQTTGEWFDVNIHYNDSWKYESVGTSEFYYEYTADIDGYLVNLSSNTLDFEYLATVDSEVTFTELETYADTYTWEFNWNPIVYASTQMEWQNETIDPGEELPFEMIPAWLQPQTEYEETYFSDRAYSEGTFDSISTFQSHFHAFQTNSTPESYVIWGNREESVFLAYSEHSSPHTGFNFKYDAKDHTFTYIDDVQYWGYPEVYSESSTYEYSYIEDSHGYIHSTVLNTDWEYTSEAVGEWDIEWEDVVPDYSVDFSSEEPIYSENTITLNWVITYSDFPIWWVDNDWTESFWTYSDLIYDYSMVVYPSTGISELSTTTSIGAQTGASDTFSGLGLGVVQTSETVTTSQLEMQNSYVNSKSTDMLNFQLNAGSVASIDFSGDKSNYVLSSSGTDETNTIAVNYMNLMHLKGDTNKTLFSETSDRIGVFLADSYQNESYSYIYDKYLVITSYPKWDGDAITHDPTFSAVAAVTSEDSTDKSAPIPGFEFSSLFIGTLVMVFLQRKK